MYSYTYDKKTGGILLNSSPTGFSKEPRPVYAAELDVLGFDQYWNYDRQTNVPYMWAEANAYWYRGVCVAKLKGGNLYNAPEIIIPTDESGEPVRPEPNGNALRPVDIEGMVEANRQIMKLLEQATVKKIVQVYEKYCKVFAKLSPDSTHTHEFHVAFSGGKDSCVLLDLVKKALPSKPQATFIVIFGDTGMEFIDTYDVVKTTKESCAEAGIPFLIAKSRFMAQESWALFGPPSRTLRWCCSVHKSTPQTLLMREKYPFNNDVSLDFVGVRAHESIARSKYEFENAGKKIKGQYDCYPLLEWTSAEIWLYIYANNVITNEAYKKGSSRAGCLFCPMAGLSSDYVNYRLYPEEVQPYIDCIRFTSDKKFTEERFKDFMGRGAWKTRADGRYVAGNQQRCYEETANGILTITVDNPLSDWKEWEKTFQGGLNYAYKKTKTGFTVRVAESDIELAPIVKTTRRQN